MPDAEIVQFPIFRARDPFAYEKLVGEALRDAAIAKFVDDIDQRLGDPLFRQRARGVGADVLERIAGIDEIDTTRSN